MSRKNSVISVAFAAETSTLSFTVGNAGSFDLVIPDLGEEIRMKAVVHGLVQKVSDAAAMPKSELTGDADKDAVTKFEAMKSVAERLVSGEWSKRSGDGSGPVSGLIFRAFSEWVSNRAKKAKKDAPSDEQIRAVYDAKSRSDQLALRTVPEIAAIIERLKSERGAKSTTSVNTDELLSDLGL